MRVTQAKWKLMEDIMKEGINPYSNVPLYQQIYDFLHAKIINNEWKPGALVPPESSLMEIYDVSRITVRRAFDMLVQDGLVYRKPGKGTLVAHRKLEHNLSRIVSFTEDMRQRGFQTSTQVLLSGTGTPTDYIAKALRIAADEEMAYLKRLRLADDEPMCIEESYLIHRFFQGVLEHDFSQQSLREVTSQQYGIRLVRANQIIRAINATAEIAEILSIRANDAVLYFERVSFSQDNIPIEFLKAYYRADRYTLYNELQGSG